MKANLYVMECLTNLHVGNGEVNFNLIDNEVEKDVIYGCPVIHSSGVKGALREWYEQKFDKEKVVSIFGSESNNKESSTKGSYKFLNANLLSRPLRNSNIKNYDYSFLNTTSYEILNNYISLRNDILNLGDEKINIDRKVLSGIDDVEIEGISATKSDDVNIKKYLNVKNWAVMPNSCLSEIDLPVVARNKLNNGVSENLWYEEFVPHHSKFYFFVIYPDDKEELTDIDGQIIQFGGNASIGYGLCKISKEF